MDDTLSQFIAQTGIDPSLARDLLESTNWNVDEALSAFEALSLGSSASCTQSKGQCGDDSHIASGKGKRGLSMVNADIVGEARHKVIEDKVPGTDERYERFEEMSDFTFVLPDLSNFPEELSDFLRRDLIETSALVALEQAGRLNWWADSGVCQRLLPLATVGDGNCLLHAASLGMWGFQDRLLTLRKALYDTLTSHLAKGAIKRRWRFQQWEKNKEAGGLLYSEQEWEDEWQEVLRIASTQRRLDHEQKAATECKKGGETAPTLASIAEKENEDTHDSATAKDAEDVVDPPKAEQDGNVKKDNEDQSESPAPDGSKEKITEETEIGAFESLEDIHVFVLAQVLRRPIIIIADQFLYGFGGEPIAPIPFGGVYLPLECDPSICIKSPLVLAFDSAHFSPLVPSEEKKDSKSNSVKASVPLVGPNYDLLPLQFSMDPGEDFVWSDLDGDSSVAKNFALSMDVKLELLKKYLCVELIKVPCTSKKDTSEDNKVASKGEKTVEPSGSNADSETKVDKKLPSKSAEKKEKSWIATQIMKVGVMAGVVGSVVHNNVYVAKLQTDKKPNYYDKMIENYIGTAKLRFEEEKKSLAKASKSSLDPGEKPQPCINPGCQLYGTSATNYLCSGCFKTQKSYSESGRYLESSVPNRSAVSNYDTSGISSYLPPPSYSAYVPYGYFCGNTIGTHGFNTPSTDQLPSYSDAVKSRGNSTESSLVSSGSVVKLEPSNGSDSTSGQTVIKCSSKDCQFYGSPEKKGYCSTCYKTYQKSLKYMAEENENKKS